MKILACIKPVLETEACIRIAPDGKSLQTDPQISLRMSRYDEMALEQALLLRDDLPGTRVEVISAGPQESEAVLKRALGMGADHGIRIPAGGEDLDEPQAIAAGIAAAVRATGYDLLLAGVMSEDGLNGQVGPLLAEYLSLPCVTAVMQIRIRPGGSIAIAERVLAEGLWEVLEVSLPAVLTVQGCSRTPRYPSLSNILRAKDQALEIAAPLPGRLDGRRFLQFEYPQKSRAGSFLEGSPQQKARKLWEALREKSLLD